MAKKKRPSWYNSPPARRKLPGRRGDPVVAGLLAEMRKGRLDAGGILADRLEELGHPLAGKFRKLWGRWKDATDGWRANWARKRRRRALLDVLKGWHDWLHQKTARLFGRWWRPLGREKWHEVNP